MSGLEMMARGGRLVYVRQTFSMDELERGKDEMTDHGAAKERPKPCPLPPEGWFCTRAIGHEGPCAAYPRYVPTSEDAVLRRMIDDAFDDKIPDRSGPDKVRGPKWKGWQIILMLVLVSILGWAAIALGAALLGGKI